MAKENIDIEITGREAKLVLEYGYPFPEHEPLFKRASKNKGWQKLSIDKFWLELILGDLCRSMKEADSEDLLEELDELCGSLENAIARHSRDDLIFIDERTPEN